MPGLVVDALGTLGTLLHPPGLLVVGQDTDLLFLGAARVLFGPLGIVATARAVRSIRFFRHAGRASLSAVVVVATRVVAGIVVRAWPALVATGRGNAINGSWSATAFEARIAQSTEHVHAGLAGIGTLTTEFSIFWLSCSA